jgi:hypothetical protein
MGDSGCRKEIEMTMGPQLNFGFMAMLFLMLISLVGFVVYDHHIVIKTISFCCGALSAYKLGKIVRGEK